MNNNEKNLNKNMGNKQLILIPKIEDYIEYSLNILLKLPRTEKFSIGSEYKKIIYTILENILLINKLYKKENTKEILKLLNEIDAKLNTNRILLRIMKKQRWIGENKFDICIKMSLIKN